jgi:hypothetical protein
LDLLNSGVAYFGLSHGAKFQKSRLFSFPSSLNIEEKNGIFLKNLNPLIQTEKLYLK